MKSKYDGKAVGDTNQGVLIPEPSLIVEEQDCLSESQESSAKEYSLADDSCDDKDLESEEASEPSTPPQPRTFFKAKRRIFASQASESMQATNSGAPAFTAPPRINHIADFTTKEEIQNFEGDVHLGSATVEQLRHVSPAVNIHLTSTTPIKTIAALCKVNSLYLSSFLTSEQVHAIPSGARVAVTEESIPLLKNLSSDVVLEVNNNVDDDLLKSFPSHLNSILIASEQFPSSKLRILGRNFTMVSFENISAQQLPKYIGDLHKTVAHIGLGIYNKMISKALRLHKALLGMRLYNELYDNIRCADNKIAFNLQDLPAGIKVILFHLSAPVAMIKSTPATVKMVSISSAFSQEQLAAIPSHVLVYSHLLSVNKIKCLPPNIAKLAVTPAMVKEGNLDFLPESIHTLFIFPDTPPEFLRRLPAHVRTILFSQVNLETQLPAIRADIHLVHDTSVIFDNANDCFARKVNEQRITTLVNKRNAASKEYLASASVAQKGKKERQVQERTQSHSNPNGIEQESEVDVQLKLKRNTLLAKFQHHCDVVRHAQSSYANKINELLRELIEDIHALGIDNQPKTVQEQLNTDKKYSENKEKLEAIKSFYSTAKIKDDALAQEIHLIEEQLKNVIVVEKVKFDAALHANDFNALEVCIDVIEKLNDVLLTKRNDLLDNFDEVKAKSRLAPDMVKTAVNCVHAMVRRLHTAESERQKECAREALRVERLLAKEKIRADKRTIKKTAAAPAASSAAAISSTSLSSASAVARISRSSPENTSRSSGSSADNSPSPMNMQGRFTSSSSLPARAMPTTPKELKISAGSPVSFQYASTSSVSSSYYSSRKPATRSLLDFADQKVKKFLDEKKSSAPREVYPYAYNASSAESARDDEEQALIDHARNRVDLYFRLLVVCYDTKMKLSLHTTTLQHGKGAGNQQTQAAHRSILPSLLDNGSGRVFLQGTRLYDEFNATDELPVYVNKFDDILERRRSRYLDIVNDVSEGKLTPVEGLRFFLCDLRDVLLAPSVKKAYQEHLGHWHERYKDKVDSVIYHSQLGSLQDILTPNDAINMCYVYQMLGLHQNEIHALNKPFEESELYRAKGKEIRDRFIEEGRLSAMRSPILSAAAAASQKTIMEAEDNLAADELMQLLHTAKINEAPLEKLSPEPRLASPEVAFAKEPTIEVSKKEVQTVTQTKPAAPLQPVVKPAIRILMGVESLHQFKKTHKAPKAQQVEPQGLGAAVQQAPASRPAVSASLAPQSVTSTFYAAHLASPEVIFGKEPPIEASKKEAQTVTQTKPDALKQPVVKPAISIKGVESLHQLKKTHKLPKPQVEPQDSGAAVQASTSQPDISASFMPQSIASTSYAAQPGFRSVAISAAMATSPAALLPVAPYAQTAYPLVQPLLHNSLLVPQNVIPAHWQQTVSLQPVNTYALQQPQALSMQALSMPALSMQALSMQALSMQALSMQALSMQALPMQALSMPALSMPALSMPALSMPALSMPALSMPALSMPALPMQALPMQALPMPALPMQALPMQALQQANLLNQHGMFTTARPQNNNSGVYVSNPQLGYERP